jgi:hypothetical protein
MATQSLLAKAGIRLTTLGSAASLAVAAPLAEGSESTAAATDPTRIGWFASRTPAQERFGVVVLGTERLAATTAGATVTGILTVTGAASIGAGITAGGSILTTVGAVTAKPIGSAGIAINPNSATGDFTLSLVPANLTANRTITFPDATGTVVASAGLTNGRVPYASGGLLVDSALLTYDATPTIGGMVVGNTTVSSSPTSGALVLGGGIGIGGNAYVGGTAASTSSTTGALVVAGGAGVSGDIYSAGGSNNFGSASTVPITFGVAGGVPAPDTSALRALSPNADFASGAAIFGRAVSVSTNGRSKIGVIGFASVENQRADDLVGVYGRVEGGASGVSQAVPVALEGYATSSSTLNTNSVYGIRTTSTSTAASTAPNVFGGSFTAVGAASSAIAYGIYASASGAILNYAAYFNAGRVAIVDATASTSTTTGALTVAGGVGIAQGLFLGTTLGQIGIAAPAVSAAGQGRIYFDSTGNVFKVSENGGAYVNLVGGGSGTVTSVGLSLPGIFSVSGSPVTTSGTLTATLATQSANTVFAGPASGSAAAPAFRSLVAADIPSISAGTVTGTANRSAFFNGSGVLADSADLTWDGSTFYINGKLTVTGLIDPTGVAYTPVAANPGGVLAASTFWVDSTGTVPTFGSAALVITSGSYANPTWITSLAGSKITGTANKLAGFSGSGALTGLSDFGYTDTAGLTDLYVLSSTGLTTLRAISVPSTQSASVSTEASGATTARLASYNSAALGSYGVLFQGKSVLISSTDLLIGAGEVTSGSSIYFMINATGGGPVASISGTTLANGVFAVNFTTASTSATTGALKVAGGLGIAKGLYLGTTLDQVGIAAPAVSAAGQGRIYFDSTGNVFKVSENGGAYVNLIGGGGGSPGGSNTQVQFNNSGSFGGSTNLTWDGSTFYVNGKLTVTGLIDPTGVAYTPVAANPGGALATSTFWVNSTGTVPTFGSSALAIDSAVVHLAGTETVTGAKTFSAILAVSNTTVSTSSITGALTVAGGLGVAGRVSLGGALDQVGISAPAVSASGHGVIYFDSSANVFKVSQNGGAYVNLIGAGGSPGGSTNAVQFNNGGTFGGSTNLTWDGSTLGVTGNVGLSGLVFGPTSFNPGGFSTSVTLWVNSLDSDRLYYGSTAVLTGAVGSDRQVQFNDAGNLGASVKFSFLDGGSPYTDGCLVVMQGTVYNSSFRYNTTTLQIQSKDGTGVDVCIDSYGSVGSYLYGRSFGGTTASPTSTQAGAPLLQISGIGTPTGSGTAQGADITFMPNTTWTGSNIGTYISLSTANVAAYAERLRLWSDGGLQLGGTFSASPGSGSALLAGNVALNSTGVTPTFLATGRHVQVVGSGAKAGVDLLSYGSAGNCEFSTHRASGTISSPSAVTNGIALALYYANGWDGSAWETGFGINVLAAVNWSTTAHKARAEFVLNTDSGVSGLRAVMSLFSSGGLSLGAAYSATDPGAGNLLIAGGLSIKGGANQALGTATLVAGTVTVSNTRVTANSRIFLSVTTVGGVQGILSVGTVTPGTSFVINSSSIADTSTVAWMIIESA